MVNLTKRFYCKFGIGVLYTEVFAFSPKVTVNQSRQTYFEKLISYRHGASSVEAAHKMPS